MKKIILSLLICGLISGVFANLIFAEETTTTTVVDTTTTTVEEFSVPQALGLNRVGLLPNSPFYFLKEWWRGIRVGLIKDPIEKSEAQLQILSEKLAEAEALAHKAPKPEVLEKAFDNYTNTMERLKIRLEGIKETSENPNIDKLLDRITEAEVRHQEVLDKILEKVPEAFAQVEGVRQNISQTLPLLRLRFENQEEFMNRLENKLQELQPLNTEPVREFRQLRIMESMQEQLRQTDLEDYSDRVQAKAEQLQERLENQIQQRTQVLKEQGFSSEEIENRRQGPGPVRIITPMIPEEKLPQSPPQGVSPSGNAPGNGASNGAGACIELWDPVCGVDGKTYSNDCFANQAGVAIQYEGECQ